MSLAHHRSGDGPPLVLIHGTGSFRHVWNPVYGALARERDVIALDLPGFGDSAPDPAGRCSVAAFADAVIGLLDELGLERPHVAGNSLGGSIALALANRGRAASTTAISPSGFWSDGDARFCRASLRATATLARALAPTTPALRSPVARTVLMSQLIARPWRLDGDEAIRATRNLASSPALAGTIDQALRERWDGDLPQGVPLTIAWGTRDRLLLPRQGERARWLLPHARFVPLRGCGHVPMSDDPELVARVLLDGSASPS
jgi:pimeloyl-ACP methyl ester carboxylesterase